MYYTACLLLTIQWQLLCQAIVGLVYKWEGLLKIVWGGCNPLNPPPPRSAPADIAHLHMLPILKFNHKMHGSVVLTSTLTIQVKLIMLDL